MGGIAGYVKEGEIISCKNTADINGKSFTGGIVGYFKNDSFVSYCANTGDVTATGLYTGGIVGYVNTTSKEYSIGYCYNTGNIEGIETVGGIAGAAWSSEGNVVICYIYNTGNVKNVYNELTGGIVGGTYYNCFNYEKVENKNIIKYGYNMGEITSIANGINQIGPGYMNCTKMYYVYGKTNYSGFGIAKDANLFKAELSNTDSVLYLLNEESSGIWTIDSNYNSRKCNFSMAIKLKKYVLIELFSCVII